MKKLLVLHLICLFFYRILDAQPSQYFIEIKEPNLLIGQYEGKNFKPKIVQSYPLNTLNIKEIETFLFQKNEKKTLFYLHAMFGGVRIYHKSSIKKLGTLEDIDNVVSIVWHTDKKSYKKQWPIAPKEGHLITELLQHLWSNQERNHHILAHSMGHRVLEGIFSTIDFSALQLNTILLAAPDISIDIFENNWQKVPEVSDKIVVYIHRGDKLLKTASKKIPVQRLGRYGFENEKLQRIENLERIDVINLAGKGFFLSTNHGYWKKEQLVFEDIKKQLHQ